VIGGEREHDRVGIAVAGERRAGRNGGTGVASHRLEHDGRKPEQAAVLATGDSLAGMPYQLDAGYRAAKANGPTAFRTWFNANEK